MFETKVANRYAKSLLGLAQEQSITDVINSDMKLILLVCRENKGLALLLQNPIVHADSKSVILKKIFENKVHEITLAFLDIITRKRRENCLEAIAGEFTELYKEYKGIETAIITSATKLDNTLRNDILNIIKRSTSSEVELIEKVNSDLIGGFVLRMDDTQYDASIAKNLKKLTREFSTNPYIKKN